MTAVNNISYFAYLVEAGKITKEEADKKLKEMIETDIKADEFDRRVVELIRKSCEKNNNIISLEVK